MKIRKVMLTLLFILAPLSLLAANRALVDLEQSYELNAALVTVPSSTSGYLLFRACTDCAVVSLQVNSNTQYSLGRDTVSLAQFREDAVMRGLIYIFYEPNSQIVTRVRLREGSHQEGDD